MGRKKEHRQEKLFEKLKSQNGLRIQNRWWREQVRWSKLPILVIKDIPEWTDEIQKEWLSYGAFGKIVFKLEQSNLL